MGRRTDGVAQLAERYRHRPYTLMAAEHCTFDFDQYQTTWLAPGLPPVTLSIGLVKHVMRQDGRLLGFMDGATSMDPVLILRPDGNGWLTYGGVVLPIKPEIEREAQHP